MAQSFQTNLLNVASAYINLLKLPVTTSSLKRSLEENPYYPSLYSLSNTFDRFQIPHTAFTIDKENFERLPPPPFVAWLKNQSTGKDFVLVTAVQNGSVSYIADTKKDKTVSREEFLNDFENIILLAEADKKSGEKDYAENRRKEIIKRNQNNYLIGAGALLLIISIFLFISAPAVLLLPASLILGIKMAGLTVSILLLIYEIDKSNAFVKNICTAGKKTNCNAVLASKGSKILGISWSEMGFFYFASTVIFLLFPGIEFSTKLFVLAVANLIAAPYIIYSLYYQWKVVKQWCPLCLTVQGVLGAELIWAVAFFWQNAYLPESPALISAILPIILCLILPITLWYVLKPLLLKSKNEPMYKAAYKRLLYNPDTFNNLLQQQQTAPEGYEHLGITIGNPDAGTTIIKVCNPYCGPCAKAHAVIHEILHNNKDVKLKLIFTASNEENDERGIVARHLLAISKKQDPVQTSLALDDWYLADKKDYAAFAEKYPLNGEIKEQKNLIDVMSNWCKEADIIGTPTFFINGKRLPDTYRIEELKYIL